MEMIVGCVPVDKAELLGFVPYKGSTKAHCSQCNCEVWLGPVQKQHCEEGHRIVCLVCALKDMEPGEALPIVPLTKKRMGE